MSTTFSVSDVKLSKDRLKSTTLGASLKVVLNALDEPEASGSNATNLVTSNCHGFVQAVHTAFDAHLPLTLAPDDVWLCIAQGFANHVNANAETLRKRFVDHEGKAVIRIQRNEFVKGSPTNNWTGAFTEFSDQIGTYIGKKRDLLVSDFSTTGPIERAASEIVLMDAMQQFFDYRCRTMCGFPSITLLGTVSDWEDVRQRASTLAEYDCSWWTDQLVPVLDEFVASAKGTVHKSFWESFYKRGAGSGGPYVTGLINTLFPYLDSKPNRYIDKCAERLGSMCGGPNPEDMGTGLSVAPFLWEYHSAEIPMELLGGFVGVAQDEEGGLRPATGWAVREPEPKREKKRPY